MTKDLTKDKISHTIEELVMGGLMCLALPVIIYASVKIAFRK